MLFRTRFLDALACSLAHAIIARYALPEAVTFELKKLAKDWNGKNSDRLINDSDPANKMMSSAAIRKGAAQAYVGPLLCGSKLIDDFAFHKDLVERALAQHGDKVLGGEMEGYVITQAQAFG